MRTGALIGGIILIIVGLAVSLLGLAIVAGTIITRVEHTTQVSLASDIVVGVMGLILMAIGITTLVVGVVLLYRRSKHLTMRSSEPPPAGAAGGSSP
jgi:hypothetical protein